MIMENNLYPHGIDSETPQRDTDVIINHERETKLHTCMAQLAHTMLMLSRELTEATKARDAIDLRYAASLIEDTRKASEISKKLIARKIQLR
jgi:hypothetical protein